MQEKIYSYEAISQTSGSIHCPTPITDHLITVSIEEDGAEIARKVYEFRTKEDAIQFTATGNPRAARNCRIIK